MEVLCTGIEVVYGQGSKVTGMETRGQRHFLSVVTSRPTFLSRGY
jgi:hypothetical protein